MWTTVLSDRRAVGEGDRCSVQLVCLSTACESGQCNRSKRGNKGWAPDQACPRLSRWLQKCVGNTFFNEGKHVELWVEEGCPRGLLLEALWRMSSSCTTRHWSRSRSHPGTTGDVDASMAFLQRVVIHGQLKRGRSRKWPDKPPSAQMDRREAYGLRRVMSTPGCGVPQHLLVNCPRPPRRRG